MGRKKTTDRLVVIIPTIKNFEGCPESAKGTSEA